MLTEVLDEHDVSLFLSDHVGKTSSNTLLLKEFARFEQSHFSSDIFPLVSGSQVKLPDYQGVNGHNMFDEDEMVERVGQWFKPDLRET